MKKLTEILLILLIPATLSVLKAQAKSPGSNYELIDSLVGSMAYDIVEKINSDTVSFDIETHPGKRLIEQKIVSHASNRGIIVQSNRAKTNYSISVNEISVSYAFCANKGDSVQRTIRVDLSGIERSDVLRPMQITPAVYVDKIEFPDISNCQSSTYDFTKGKIPEKKSTFYKKYLEPTIFAISAVLTAVLLFSARS